MSDHLQQFFKLCDPEGKKSVDREAFKKLCRQFGIADRDADIIFEDLDADHDDRISFEDFSRGFSDYLHSAGSNCQENDPTREPEEDPWKIPHVQEETIFNTNNQSQKLQLVFDELQSSEKHHLVPYLENTVEELLQNLNQLQEENALLGESWKKEKIEHESHLKRMEEVMDSQVREAEMELRRKAQAEVEDARKVLQTKMDAEMDNLQAHLALFEKVNSWLQTHPVDGKEARLDELRLRLDDADNENRQLRLSLLDTKTSIAIVQSQSLQMRNLYEEKCKELMNERVKVREVLNQQDDLSQQLTLLHDANRRLQDTNDALRQSMERLNCSQKRVSKSFDVPSRAKSGSIIGDYMEPVFSTGNMERVEDTDDEENNEVYHKDSFKTHTRPTLRRAKSVDMPLSPTDPSSLNNAMGDTRMNHSDSGFSTTRESQELEDTSTLDSSLPQRDVEIEEVKYSTPLKRPLSMPTQDLDLSEVKQDTTIPKQIISTIDVVPFQERNLKSSASADNLECDDYPKRKIVDIIRQLGIKDDEVRISSTRYPRSAENSPTRCKSFNQKISSSFPREPFPQLKKTYTCYSEPQKSDSHKSRKILSAGSQTLSEDTDFPFFPTPSSFTIGASPKTISSPKAEEHSNKQPDVVKGKKTFFTKEAESDEDISYVGLEEDDDYEPNGPAERTFKIIFLGDAGVGKSSFALRISQGVFIQHMSSTLGVDFLMRRMRVDGHNIDVQLWDTAGQERFRSITKPYFRKADGVMLLYDCTSELSFMHVRQWVEDVNVMASDKLPLMIVGNKVDLRPVYSQLGTKCISTLEGQKLARDCDTTFMEASAKDGQNVLPAIANLVRSMTNHRELQQSASTMKLHDRKKQSSGCCR